MRHYLQITICFKFKTISFCSLIYDLLGHRISLVPTKTVLYSKVLSDLILEITDEYSSNVLGNTILICIYVIIRQKRTKKNWINHWAVLVSYSINICVWYTINMWYIFHHLHFKGQPLPFLTVEMCILPTVSSIYVCFV